MHNTNIFLIANNHYLSQKYINYINKISIKNNDIIIRFNHCENRIIFNGKTNAIALRSNGSLYWGFHINFIRTIRNKIIYLIGRNRQTNMVIQHFIKQGCIVFIIDYTQNKDNKTDSSGMQIINYFRKANSKNKIFLIGFDFHKGNRNSSHNFTKEQKNILQYDNVIRL